MTPSPSTRIVLITGAASGIGAAISRRLAGADTSLVLHTRGSQPNRREDLLRVAAETEKSGSPTFTLFGDLAESGVAESVIAQSIERFGALDQVVSNAGFADRRLLGELDYQTLELAFKGMPGAFFKLMTAALPALKASNWGRVIAISSFVTYVYNHDVLFPVTAAAKAGIESLAKSLAVQLAPSGTTVNCVAPGYTHKDATGHSAISEEAWQRARERTPMGRIAKPDDIAAMVQFLLSQEARHVTGQVIHVDGGLSIT